MTFRPGQHVGPYVIEGLLGSGGMASVWRAWDEKRSQQVAIKIMADPLSDEEQLAGRFMDEVKRHKRLSHPNIVALREVFSVAGQPCMVMDLARGGSLAALLDACPERRLPFERALPIMSDVLAALDHAHRQGMVHRDVKPSNVLLDGTRTHALLSDFGIALAAGEKRRTRAGLPVGTSAYMSPEQIRASREIDYRSDVYSAGCVLYEMLTGRPPFVAEGPQSVDDNAARAAVLAMHLRDTPLAPRRRAPSVPAHVSALILRALEKDAGRRIPGCAEFARLLAAPPERFARGTWRRPARVGAIAAIAAIVAVAVIGAMVVASGA